MRHIRNLIIIEQIKLLANEPSRYFIETKE
ncbi:hypothetical protein Megvenef_01415 [Candidatus Megaera venefica]|uniref:Uncharacterized protein n=1 Tax=Candidatus Megaera venefica TaxID=2055910 RepID=A0ABU5NE47_9RICK|nr:hypothetical protein [Candidatus Megaera venefica]